MPKGLRKDSDSDLKKISLKCHRTNLFHIMHTLRRRSMHSPMAPWLLTGASGPAKIGIDPQAHATCQWISLGWQCGKVQRTCPNGYLSSLQWNGRVVAGSRFERKHSILNERSGEVLACISGCPFKWACSQLVGTTGNTNAWRSNSIYFPGLLQSLGPGSLNSENQIQLRVPVCGIWWIYSWP